MKEDRNGCLCRAESKPGMLGSTGVRTAQKLILNEQLRQRPGFAKEQFETGRPNLEQWEQYWFRELLENKTIGFSGQVFYELICSFFPALHLPRNTVHLVS